MYKDCNECLSVTPDEISERSCEDYVGLNLTENDVMVGIDAGMRGYEKKKLWRYNSSLIYTLIIIYLNNSWNIINLSRLILRYVNYLFKLKKP